MQWEHYELDLLDEKDKRSIYKESTETRGGFCDSLHTICISGTFLLRHKNGGGGGNYLNQTRKLITGIRANTYFDVDMN